MSTPKKNALGRGLSALLENIETDITSKPDFTGAPVVAGSVSHIQAEKIEPNPFQPRKEFDLNAMNELAESIRKQGIIQPITVRKLGYDKYQIISGERRWRASKIAGLESVPCYVRIANDQGMLEMALVENLQRHDLNPLEIGISFKRLIEECSITQEELAERVGKDRSTVTNYLRLLKLPPEIQKALLDNVISMGHARALINVDDPAIQIALFKEMVSKHLSVREVESLVRSSKPEEKNKRAHRYKPVTGSHRHIQDSLSSQFETRVEVKSRKDGSGELTFSYFSESDLERLVDLLTRQ
jgi:ParB family chromosome partitioning protein